MRPAHENWGLGWLLRNETTTGWFGFGEKTSPGAFGHAGANNLMSVADPATGLAVAFLTTNAPPNSDVKRVRNTITNLLAESLL